MKELIHHPYEKITEDLDKYKFTEKDYRSIRKHQWVVTEKVHGAHLCIHTNGEIITYAKRKEILASGDDFFNYHHLKKELEPKLKELFTLVKKDTPDVSQIAVHGELFGGEYPHPEVLPVKGIQAIQTGIYYCPDIRFYAFDIGIIRKGNDKTYVDFNTFTLLLEKVSLLYSHALFKGSFHDVMAFDITFETTIPSQLGLPSLGPENKAEGIVIKPEKSFYLDTKKGKVRPVIKRKIPEFSEDKRYNQAKKWNKWEQQQNKPGDASTKKKKTQIEITESFIKEEIDPLITRQRLASAISKIGRVCKKNRQRILGALTDDVLETLSITFPDSYNTLDENDKKKLYTIIKKKCKELIHP